MFWRSGYRNDRVSKFSGHAAESSPKFTSSVAIQNKINYYVGPGSDTICMLDTRIRHISTTLTGTTPYEENPYLPKKAINYALTFNEAS